MATRGLAGLSGCAEPVGARRARGDWSRGARLLGLWTLLSSVASAQGGADSGSAFDPLRAFAARIELPTRGNPEGVLLVDLDGDGRDELLAVTRNVVWHGDAPHAGTLHLWSASGGAEPRVIPLPDYLLGPRVADLASGRFVVLASRSRNELLFLDPLAPDPLETLSRIPLPGRPRVFDVGPLTGAGRWTAAVATAEGATAEGALVLFDPFEGLRSFPLLDPQPRALTVRAGSVLVGSQAALGVRVYRLEPDGLHPGEALRLGGIPRAATQLAARGGGAAATAVVGGAGSLWIVREGSLETVAVGSVPIALVPAGDPVGTDLFVLSHQDLEYTLYRDGAKVHAGGAGLDCWDMDVGDFDGDGALDLAFANRGAARVSIVFGTAAGSFHEGRRVRVGGGPRALAAADLDGDGRPELLSLDAGSGELSLLALRGAGHERVAAHPAPGAREALVTGDFDGDGRLDAAFLVQATDAAGAPTARVRLLPGDGTGGFVAQGAREAAVGARAMDLLALGGAARPRLVVAGAGESPDTGALHLIAASGDGSLETLHELSLSGAPVALASLRLAQRTLVAAAVGGSARSGIALFDVVGSDGSARLEERDFLDCAPLTPVDLTSFDHDGYGARELALLARAGGRAPAVLRVYRHEAGGWRLLREEQVGRGATAVAAGDFDGDGREDLAVSDGELDAVHAWRSTKDGLTRLPDLGAGRAPSALLLSDLDGDGRADLVVANERSDDLSLLPARAPSR